MDYIRRTYNVPAKRGGRVLFVSGSDYEEMEGTIVGSRSSYLRVRFDGARNVVNLHPTWNIKYMPDGPEFPVRSVREGSE